MRSALTVALVLLAGCGGMRLEDRTGPPALPASALEMVAKLDWPPGNVAVSRDARVFLSLHPAGDPPVKVVELVDGKPVPYPDLAFQETRGDRPSFDTVLALRIDRQDRLWTLDYARYGRGQPRLLAFDLHTNQVVHRHDFASHDAGLLSMLNDFQVDPAGERVYIAETSPILQRPALIVYDVARQTTRRVLDRDRSVRAGNWVIHTPEREMKILGLMPIRIGVDSITLDDRGEWLYYGPFSGDRLYRIRTADLNQTSLTPEALAARVEDFAPKTISDGLSIDADDTVYVSDPEHNAVLALGQDRVLRTVLKDSRLRWPDGFSFGPDGWLYVTCSSLQHVMFRTTSHMRAHAPYHVFRFRPGRAGVPGR
ncbi:MAG TPA: L-dopachrome tautomerase-related protein [Candidatus Binatia bacterium]|nr:L-dopachrome tautomerase-related protein [Candidatus Binatia bacterium]